MPAEPESTRSPEFLSCPLALLAGFFALGIVLERSEQPRLSGTLLLCATVMCLLAGLVFLRAGRTLTSFLLALAGFTGAGATTAQLFELRFPPNHISHLWTAGANTPEPIRLEGWVASTPLRNPHGLQFDVEVTRLERGSQSQPMSGRVRLRLAAAEDAETSAAANSMRLDYGDRIRALVRLRRPRVYQNPGSFNFRTWMENIEDLYWVGTIKSPLLIEKLPGSPVSRISRVIQKTRQRLLRAIDRLYPPWSAEGRNAAVLKAILLGDRASLDSDTIENFRKTGLYHLLVISGLHVGLLALLAGMFLRCLPLRETSRTVVVLALLMGYAFLVEQRAPTLRATLMISVYLLARLLYRGHAPLNAIGFAALVLLLYRPAWLFETGFQLSFSAALLIAGLAVPILERTTEPYRRGLFRFEDIEYDATLPPRLAQFRLDLRSLIAAFKRRLSFLEQHPALAVLPVTALARTIVWTVNMLLFSAILQACLLLPMAETFHRVSYAGIALNALAIPVMTVLLGMAVPIVVVAAVSPSLAPWLAHVLALPMKSLFALTDLPRLPSWLSYRVPEPPAWVAWGFALSVVIAAWALGRRVRVFWMSLGAFCLFAFLISHHPFAPKLPHGMLEVTTLDCGGGDAVFLVLPDQSTVLVGACGGRLRSAREGAFQGRRWDPGEEIVSSYLWSRGLKKLNIVALTDMREDHLGGLAAVIGNFRVEEFWHGVNPSSPQYQDLLQQVRRRGTFDRQVNAGDLLTRGGALIRCLWPPVPASTSPQPPNETALVLRIEQGPASVLLPGDISTKVEKELARSPSTLESRVLKVARHASKSSCAPEFLARVSPRVALVAGDATNPFYSPHPETLARLRSAGIRVFRTDLQGAVTVQMKGPTLIVRTDQTLAGEGTTVLPETASADETTSRVP